MKTFRLIGMAVVAMVLSLSLAACSSDDDDDSSSSNSLAGSTYKITKWVDSDGDDYYDEDDADDDEVNPIGVTLKFNADGSVTQSKTLWDYFKYTLDGSTLTFILGEDGPDDCMVGTITFSGSTATFKYHWEDYDGKWVDDDVYTMTLVKQ